MRGNRCKRQRLTTKLDTGVGVGGGRVLDPDTSSFRNRVEADGGVVEEVLFLDDFIRDAKLNNYWSDIVAAYSPSWGYKTVTGISDLYSVVGPSSDIVQATGSAQPTFNSKVLNGKSTLETDGVAQYIQGDFTFSAPQTLILAGFTIETFAGTSRVCDTGNIGFANQRAFQHSLASPNVRQLVGASTGNDDGNLVVGTASHVRVLFDSTSSALQVDGNAETTSSINASTGGGFTFGANSAGGSFSANSVGAVVLLDAAVDAGYAAKMSAIRTFFNSAYGTP